MKKLIALLLICTLTLCACAGEAKDIGLPDKVTDEHIELIDALYEASVRGMDADNGAKQGVDIYLAKSAAEKEEIWNTVRDSYDSFAREFDESDWQIIGQYIVMVENMAEIEGVAADEKCFGEVSALMAYAELGFNRYCARALDSKEERLIVGGIDAQVHLRLLGEYYDFLREMM